jgi:hypothetical protein
MILSLRRLWILCLPVKDYVSFLLHWNQRENLIKKVDHQEFKVDNKNSK